MDAKLEVLASKPEPQKLVVEAFGAAVARIAGGDFDSFEKLNVSSELELVLQDIIQQERQLIEASTKIVERLDQVISPALENRQKKQLQKLKRALTNGDPANPDQVELFLTLVEEEDREGIKKFFKDYEGLLDALEAYSKHFDRDLLRVRGELRSLAGRENLQKGLVTSSHSLLERIKKYYLGDQPFQVNKKFLQTEQGLFQYVSRIYSKTSPFSTFTNLAIADVNGKTDRFIEITDPQKPLVRGQVRLNAYIGDYIKVLLTKLPEERHYLPLKINPSAVEMGDSYKYLTGNYNVESFQKIKANDFIEIILEIIRESSDGDGMIYQSLLEEILEEVDIEKDQADQYIQKLIEYGLLEYNFLVSNTDPDWDHTLIQRLRQFRLDQFEEVQNLIETLQDLRISADEFIEADSDGRHTVMIAAFNRLRDTLMIIHKKAGLPEQERLTWEEWQKQGVEAYREGKKKYQEELRAAQKAEASSQSEEEKPAEEPAPAATESSEQTENTQPKAKPQEEFKIRSITSFGIKPELLFLEDTLFDAGIQLNREVLQSAVEKIEAVCQSLRIFNAYYDEIPNIEHFFRENYSDTQEVPVLDFYEAYYRDFKKPFKKYLDEKKKNQPKEEKNESEQQQQRGEYETPEYDESNPYQVDFMKVRNELMTKWLEKFNALVFSKVDFTAPDTNLTYEELSRIKEEAFGDRLDDLIDSSNSAFVQFYYDAEKQKVMTVLQMGCIHGYGRFFTRFLHLFDEKYTEMIQESNLEKSRGELLMELNDAACFNANIHPPLLPYEIWVPRGNNNLPSSRQIPVTELSIKKDEHGRLRLFHQDKYVRTMDMGFQSLRGRTQLYSLLEKFSGMELILLGPLGNTYISRVLNIMESANSEEEGESQEGKENKEEYIRRIIHLPRLVFEDELVLNRRTWMIPFEELPRRKDQESDAKWFLKINKWRTQLNLPKEAFIYLNKNRFFRPPSDEVKKKFRFKAQVTDDYKPQYINFLNPISMLLFEKTIPKVTDTLEIVEMLPGSDELVFQVDGKKYVSEFLVQWHKTNQHA